MNLQQRINAFSSLGNFIDSLITNTQAPMFMDVLAAAKIHNGWFTKENVLVALSEWRDALTIENLHSWTSRYKISEIQAPKTIAVVMAGNIPLVGFHDFLSVLITGHRVLIKPSSSDKVLLTFLSKKLCELEPRFNEYINFTDKKLENFDAVIATGSNNTARYFEYYFNKYPSIIRKNRNSLAVITGNETREEMEALSQDIFQYFGLGCRNVSKILVPENYNWDHFFNAMFVQKEVINNHKYANNYDYNKAVYLMSNIPLLDNEFMLLKEDEGYSSPIAVVFYEHYKNHQVLASKLQTDKEKIQCVVGKNYVNFGQAQHPQLWDYADGVDTIAFAINL